MTQKEILYNIEEIKKYIPVIINNGLLDQFIYRLKIHNLRMMVNNGRYLETFNILSFTSPPFTIPNFRWTETNEILLLHNWYEQIDPEKRVHLTLLLLWNILGEEDYNVFTFLIFSMSLTVDLLNRKHQIFLIGNRSSRIDKTWFEDSPLSLNPITTNTCYIVPFISNNNFLSEIAPNSIKPYYQL